MTTRSAVTSTNVAACTQAAVQATLHAGLALAALLASVASLFTGPGPRRDPLADWPAVAGAPREAALQSPDAHGAPNWLPFAAQPVDTALRSRLLQRLALQPAWQTDTANVHVADGVAVFQGLFKRESERDECVAIALRMPGIRAVRDQRVRLREWQALG